MDKYLWAAYRTDTNNNPYGRDFIGYIGWHERGDKSGAMAEAQTRFPEIPIEHMQVQVA